MPIRTPGSEIIVDKSGPSTSEKTKNKTVITVEKTVNNQTTQKKKSGNDG